MRKINKRKNQENVITLPEDVTISMGDREIILEKGDRVRVMENSGGSVVLYESPDEEEAIVKKYAEPGFNMQTPFKDSKGKFGLYIEYDGLMLAEFPILYNDLPMEAGDRIRIAYDFPYRISPETKALYKQIVEDIIYGTGLAIDEEGDYSEWISDSSEQITSNKPYYNFATGEARVNVTLPRPIIN